MVGLEITFQIAPDKRLEFLQTARSLIQAEVLLKPEGPVVVEQVGAKDCFLWREKWATRRKVDERLHSKPVNTLLGAIQVLGKLTDLQIIELRTEPRQ
jgi:hypothetical protein